jgi:tripartite-type tricarboxylate transporter receptor subunit TctC
MALAQVPYPERTIHVIVPYPPGGNTDIVTRQVMMKLSERLGQSIVVENKPGANSIIGTDLLAKAAPDGYTLGVVIGAYAINQSLYKKLPYKHDDFAPVSLLARTGLVLAANPQVPRTFSEFVAHGRKGEPPMSFSTSGLGGANHLLGARFVEATGIKGAVAIPYKGSADARSDLLSGRVQFTFDATASMKPYFDKGTLTPIVVTSHERMPLAPDVPTIGEMGFPQLVTYAWAGLLAPAGTPDTIVQKLSKEIAAALRDPEIRTRLEANGSEPIGGTPEELDAFIREEIRVAGDIIQKLGLPLQ